MQPPTKIDPSVVIGWFHTDSLNRERDAEVTEKNIGEECNQGDPDQELWCERGEKEFSDLMTDSHPV
jgi:23S rRNA A1618 N6-methylase RlmF